MTRDDVAKKAGVTVTSVSRVMNNRGYVAKEKREAVLKAAEALGYRSRRDTVPAQSKYLSQILFCARNLGSGYIIELYRGMVKYARENGRVLLLCGILDIAKINPKTISGVILPSEYDAEYFVKQSENKFTVPVVAASCGAYIKPPRNISFVEVDINAAARLLFKYLLKKGHRRVAFATPYKINIKQPRHVAIIDEMQCLYGDKWKEHIYSMEQNEYDTARYEDFNLAGEALARCFMQSGFNASVIMCFNDDLAVGMLRYFLQAGIKVPEDISVTGFDGVYISRYSSPMLTTVNLSPFRQGEECVRVLIELITGVSPKSYYSVSKECINVYEGSSVRDMTID